VFDLSYSYRSKEAAVLESQKETDHSTDRLRDTGPLLMKRGEAAELLGLSISELSELSSDINPTIPFVRLRPGGDKYWTREGLQMAIDHLYRDQMPTHLFPRRLLQAA
jgi:hypothetical protein